MHRTVQDFRETTSSKEMTLERPPVLEQAGHLLAIEYTHTAQLPRRDLSPSFIKVLVRLERKRATV